MKLSVMINASRARFKYIYYYNATIAESVLLIIVIRN